MGDQSSSSGNEITQTSSSSLFKTTRLEFAQSMATLCVLKRTTDFTQAELEAWHGFLGGFKKATLDRAVMAVGATENDFPALSTLFQACRKIEAPEKPYAALGDGNAKSLYESELLEIAARLSIEV